MNKLCFTPQQHSVFTVKELIEILNKANQNAEITIGRNVYDCGDYIERVVICDNLVAFFTSQEDNI